MLKTLVTLWLLALLTTSVTLTALVAVQTLTRALRTTLMRARQLRRAMAATTVRPAAVLPVLRQPAPARERVSA